MLYADAPDETRQQLNGTFYKAFYLDDDPLTVTGNVLTPLFEEIHEANLAYQRQKGASSAETGIATVTRITGRPGRNKKAHEGAKASKDSLTRVLADVFPVSVSSKRVMVELRGLEPLTFSLRRLRLVGGRACFGPTL
jgi:site-specific DNA recombinase